MSSGVELENVDKITEMLTSYLDPESRQRALGKACALVEDAARTKAPIGDTGDLRKFMSSRIEGDIGIVFNPLEYAPYVEYGTGLYAEGGNGRKDVPWAYEDEETGELIWTAGQKPIPFLRPALYENRTEIVRMFKEGLKDD